MGLGLEARVRVAASAFSRSFCGCDCWLLRGGLPSVGGSEASSARAAAGGAAGADSSTGLGWSLGACKCTAAGAEVGAAVGAGVGAIMPASAGTLELAALVTTSGSPRARTCVALAVTGSGTRGPPSTDDPVGTLWNEPWFEMTPMAGGWATALVACTLADGRFVTAGTAHATTRCGACAACWCASADALAVAFAAGAGAATTVAVVCCAHCRSRRVRVKVRVRVR